MHFLICEAFPFQMSEFVLFPQQRRSTNTSCKYLCECWQARLHWKQTEYYWIYNNISSWCFQPEMYKHLVSVVILLRLVRVYVCAALVWHIINFVFLLPCIFHVFQAPGLVLSPAGKLCWWMYFAENELHLLTGAAQKILRWRWRRVRRDVNQMQAVPPSRRMTVCFMFTKCTCECLEYL